MAQMQNTSGGSLSVRLTSTTRDSSVNRLDIDRSRGNLKAMQQTSHVNNLQIDMNQNILILNNVVRQLQRSSTRTLTLGRQKFFPDGLIWQTRLIWDRPFREGPTLVVLRHSRLEIFFANPQHENRGLILKTEDSVRSET